MIFYNRSFWSRVEMKARERGEYYYSRPLYHYVERFFGNFTDADDRLPNARLYSEETLRQLSRLVIAYALYDKDKMRLVKHIICVAINAALIERLAGRGVEDQCEAFTHGLTHDIGKLYLDHDILYPDDESMFDDSYRAHIATHSLIGFRKLRELEAPEQFAIGAAAHHWMNLEKPSITSEEYYAAVGAHPNLLLTYGQVLTLEGLMVADAIDASFRPYNGVQSNAKRLKSLLERNWRYAAVIQLFHDEYITFFNDSVEEDAEEADPVLAGG